MNLKSFVRHHQLISYFVLAYGITWSGIFILLVAKGFDFTTIHTQETIFIFLMMFLGPSMSSFILTAVLDGRSGFSELWLRFTQWKLSWQWYAVALWLYVLSPAVSFDRGLLWQGIFAASLWAIVAIVFASKQKTLFLKGSE